MTRSRDSVSIALAAIALILAVHGTPATAEPVDHTCSEAVGDVNSTSRAVSLHGSCNDSKRPASRSNADAHQSTTTTSEADSHLEHRTVSACFPNQLNNPDFEGCRDQSENFCPEGSWIRAETVDTRTPDDNALYGQPVCWTGASPAGGAGAPPLSIDEVRTLLVLDPEKIGRAHV